MLLCQSLFYNLFVVEITLTLMEYTGRRHIAILYVLVCLTWNRERNKTYLDPSCTHIKWNIICVNCRATLRNRSRPVRISSRPDCSYSPRRILRPPHRAALPSLTLGKFVGLNRRQNSSPRSKLYPRAFNCPQIASPFLFSLASYIHPIAAGMSLNAWEVSREIACANGRHTYTRKNVWCLCDHSDKTDVRKLRTCNFCVQKFGKLSPIWSDQIAIILVGYDDKMRMHVRSMKNAQKEECFFEFNQFCGMCRSGGYIHIEK